MNKQLLLATLIFFAAGRTQAQPSATQPTATQPVAAQSTTQAATALSPAEKEIIAAMNDATVKWNKGDLDAYMALYDASATMMLSSGRVGLDSIRGM